MAEQGILCDLKSLEQQLQSLFSRFAQTDLQTDSKPFCSTFCKLVEYYASRWKGPLPQLGILERALCCFTQASVFFTVNCDHVLRTLSSLALSIFELLLFFDQTDFFQNPLKKTTVTFQECFAALAKYQNVHLLHVERLLRAGGPWTNQNLHAILSESPLPQTEVEECITSEPPVFFELRVRYLLSCQRLPEAQALAKCCAGHPSVGQHLFFYQVYLTGLYKTVDHERLLEEFADFRGKDAVHFLCTLESEENDELLLDFSRAFLSLQMHRGDMHFLCDLVSIWGRLHSRLKTPKKVLLEECEQLILSTTNVNAIFPFIKVIIRELNEEGVQFCVELCANALRSCLPCDVITKSLIYKTMASLVPRDLEICRACALLVFFLERSVEAYKMVYILYMLPDQEYHVDCCPIGNCVRFETLQALKKDLYFDPEFWNLIALRTNCLKLMNEKVLSAALDEIMEEKWVPSYCRKANNSSSRSKSTKENALAKRKKRLKEDRQNHKNAKDKEPPRKRGRPRLNKNLPLNKKGNQGSKQWKKSSSEPLWRSSIWQMDRLHPNRALDYRENRRTTRHSERVPAKRMIRTPKWLLEDSGTLDKTAPLIVRRQHASLPYLPLRRRNVVVKSNAKEKDTSESAEQDVPPDSQTASTAPQLVLELSLPDNELFDTFTDDTSDKSRGLPQMLFYRPTLKVPSETLMGKGSPVIIKAQSTQSFIQMLHCYTRKSKGKKVWTRTQGSASTITRSSHVDASNKEQISDKSTVEMKVTISSQTPPVADNILRNSNENHGPQKTSAVLIDTETMQTTVTPLESPAPGSVAEMDGKATSGSVMEVEAKVPLLSAVEFEVKDTQAIILDVKVKSPSVLVTEVEVKATPDTPHSAMEVEVEVAAQKNGQSPRRESQTTEHIASIASEMTTAEENKGQIKLPLPSIATVMESNASAIANNVAPVKESEEDTPTKTIPVPINKPTVKDEHVEDVQIVVHKSETQNIDTQATMGNANDKPALKEEGEVRTEMSPKSKQIESVVDNIAPVQSQTEADGSMSSQTFSSPSKVSVRDDDLAANEPECEESRLEFVCHFCHKACRGRYLVPHAMFHYRKDECMFCGVAFKNNLKAMIHLSNHLEKLKKLQNPTAATSPDKSMTKDKTEKAKTSSKTKAVFNVNKVRQKKPIPPVRKLRSGYTFRHMTKQEQSKDLRTKAMHKINGHIGKGKENDRSLITKTRLRRRSHEIHKDLGGEGTGSVPIKMEKGDMPSEAENKEKRMSKVNIQMERNNDSKDKFHCPVDGCTWLTVKNQVALFVYHALDDHYSDQRPLELAFSKTNNKCSICKRVLYSFEHFQHHVERHRFSPRHPCPHKGCTARFKTTFEMRRHARKHSPLQAMCCLPGCPKLFICLWQLILHEKDHYSNRPKAMQKDQPEKKRKDQTIESTDANKKVSSISICKSTGRHKTKDPMLSKKKLSAQSAVASRLLQRLRKRQLVKNSQVTHKMVSSAGKSNDKLSHSLQRDKKSDGSKDSRPPKNSHNENIRPQKSKMIIHSRKEKNTLKIHTRPKETVKRKGDFPSSERTKPTGKAKKVTNVNVATTDTNDKLATRHTNAELVAENMRKTKNDSALCELGAKDVPNTISTDAMNAMLAGKLTEIKNSNMAVPVFSSYPPILGEIVASPQHAGEPQSTVKNTDSTTETSHRTEVLHISNQVSALTEMPETAFEIMRKHEQRAANLESRDTAACDITDMEEMKDAEITVNEGSSMEILSQNAIESSPFSASSSPNESPNVKRNRPSLGNKNEILSGLKSLVKSKKDKIENEDKDSGLKRKNELSESVSKKLKFESQKQEEAETLGETSSESDGKVQMTDSTPVANDVNKTNKIEKAGRKNKVDVKVKSSLVKPMVKQQKKTVKQPKSTTTKEQPHKKMRKPDTKILKPKPATLKIVNIVSKTSTRPEVSQSSSSEVNGGPIFKAGNHSEHNSGNPAKRKSSNKELTPKIPGEEQGETCLKDTRIYNWTAVSAPVEPESPLATFEKALSEYKKKPYMRLPATAYLEERFTVMPKRRKDLSMFIGACKKVPKKPEATPPVPPPPPQRQRCTKCFSTFSSDQELQRHVKQTCSSLFGFDSDEEGAS
ncbi:unnamed protein product [Knipowitschia caucasica]